MNGTGAIGRRPWLFTAAPARHAVRVSVVSLRGVGYSLETAVADLIDNSIAANANEINIRWHWREGVPIAAVLDDGDGMSEKRLVEAMRFGGVGPDEVRSSQDLGRFGLGLKTASLSQCRKLTVVSKKDSKRTSFTWDIDRLRKPGSGWDLIEGDDGLEGEFLKEFDLNKKGTLVVWRKIDFGRKEDRPDHAAFLRDMERLDRHLGMVFHRFIAGDAPRKITIEINGHSVEAWDPFLQWHDDIIKTPNESIPSPGGRVLFRGFVLPHRDRFKNQEQFDKAGGPDGWTAQQGFYIYRHKRLLSAGGWLGLGGSRAWTRDEASKLARLRLDIPNSGDQDWRIDIRKSIARPPDAIRGRLQRLAEDVRRSAREIFVHRGQYGPRAPGGEVSRIWLVNKEGVGRRYAISRHHQVVTLLRQRVPADGRGLLDALLDLIERTVPVDRVWLDVTEKGVPDPVSNLDDRELVESARVMATMMEKAGMPFSEAVAIVWSMDPFDKIENLAKRIVHKAKEDRK
jgi:hypothetical protein